MAIKKRIVATVVALGAICSHSQADSLFNELSYLQQNHPLIAASLAQKTAAEENHRASKGVRRPVVSVTSQIGHEESFRPGGVETSEFMQTARLSVTQRVYDFGATSGVVDAAGSRVNVSKAVVNQTQQNVLQAGIEAYFGLVLAHERLLNAHESADRIQRQQETEQAKIDQGSGSRADYLQAESQLLSAQSRAASEEGALQIAQYRFEQIFGKAAPSYADLELQATPSTTMPTTLQAAETLALMQLPSLKAATANLRAAKDELRSSKGTYYPRFDVVGEAEYRNNAQAVIGSLHENRLLVRMEYDFDLGLTRRGVVGAARANQTAATHDKVNQERLALEAVRSAWARYQTALKNFHINERQLESATEFLELAIKERELGKRTLRDILNGELVRLNAKTRLASARVELTVSSFEILRSTGQLSVSAI